ncbi:hypothetical protein QE109_02300 [Fusibacter bizertensis]|uniref:Peptidase C39-like domain-containing protein n=1 Tax=Fusibacter bizertensis TaxID=1488331 RepID=A0ABT6N968_9FIRM|nr:hypothetical protein [Fusibacter bizertensis]MDH8676958.1 hypothetical protein [Fusibacter bizertensis]
MLKYELSNYSSITAQKVCDDLDVPYEGATWTTIMSGYNYYFKSPYLPTKVDSTMNSTMIKTIIDNNDPACIAAVSGNSAHHVALCGYSQSSSSFIVRIMDPGSESFKTGTLSNGIFTFSYNNNVYTWDKTVRLYYSY